MLSVGIESVGMFLHNTRRAFPKKKDIMKISDPDSMASEKEDPDPRPGVGGRIFLNNPTTTPTTEDRKFILSTIRVRIFTGI